LVAVPGPANLSLFGFVNVNFFLSFAADMQPASSCAAHGLPSPLLPAGFTRYSGYLTENWIFSTKGKNKQNIPQGSCVSPEATSGYEREEGRKGDAFSLLLYNDPRKKPSNSPGVKRD